MLAQIDPALSEALSSAFDTWNEFYHARGYASLENAIQQAYVPKILNVRTPNELVPNTEAGEAYKAVPNATVEIAKKLLSVFDERDVTGPISVPYSERVKNLSDALLLGPWNVDFQTFSKGNWQANFLSYAERPIFAWDENLPLYEFSYRDIKIPLPFQRINGNAYIAPPLLIYYLSQGLLTKASHFIAYNDSIGFYDSNSELLYTLQNEFSNSIVGANRFDAYPGVTYKMLDLLDNVKNIVAQIEKAETKSFWIKTIVAALAFVAIPGAVTAIETGGWTIANSAKLLSTVDRIPGVDFGVGSKLLGVVNRAYARVGDVATYFDSPVKDSFNGANAVDVFENGFYEVESPQNYWSDYFNVGDQANFLDSLVAQTSNIGFDVGSFVTDLAKTYVQYDLAKRALEQGRPAPSVQPAPRPGGRRTLPDGSVAVVNADGSTTIRRPSGETLTVQSSGNIVRGGGDWIPGVPNIMLIGGAALIGALLLARR